ncbi:MULTISPECIES: hypothetical protein [unclassified Burkholderia]|uniref:hypothetical protein n=1 Tax=unclassified Burkholderia TaxID=2613784 RepID=UPI002AAFE0F5|nr:MULTISPECIES: hypothetical protein [unclassified Burkholderia]
MIRRLTIDLSNAAKMIFAPSAFLAAEEMHLKVINAEHVDPTTPSERAALVRCAFWRSAAMVAVALALGASIAALAKVFGNSLPSDWQLGLQAAAAAILLWGTVFVRGWDIQTMGGRTLTERANRTLYLTLYFVGTTLGVFATLCPVESVAVTRAVQIHTEETKTSAVTTPTGELK